MPFTVSHVAAVVPLRRLGLVWPALIAGSMAPDFEYLLRLDPVGRYGHGVPGMFVFSLPAGLIALWLFERFVREPAIQLLPPAVEERVPPGSFRWGGAGRFLNVLVSIQLGIFTHVVWDSFTHRSIQGYPRALLLRGGGGVPAQILSHFKLLQQGSTIVGGLVLIGAFVLWFRRTAPCRVPSTLSSRRRLAMVAFICAVALCAGIARASASAGFPPRHGLHEYFAVLFAVSAMAFFALTTLCYGVWKTVSGDNPEATADRRYDNRSS